MRPIRQVLDADPVQAAEPAAQPAGATRLFGRQGRADVQRAITECLGGRLVLIEDPAGPQGRRGLLVLPVDGLSASTLAEFAAIARSPFELIVSGTRAHALRAGVGGAARITLAPGTGLPRVLALAGGDAGALGESTLRAEDPAGVLGQAAVELAKLAHLLPAMLSIPLPLSNGRESLDIVGQVQKVAAREVLGFRAGQADALRLVSRARVPLPQAPVCECLVFRDDLGHPWTALRIGEPDPRGVVPVRLHSACLTGDAFGSCRCDCGDQLSLAVGLLERMGGGVLLYLNQEGCGIGLANKMRAYRLQDDAGLDTIDANTTLGFQRDERDYDTAARMLRMLGLTRIALLTNNPSKIDGLERTGLEVCERIPLLAPVSGGNRRYLQTKRERAGHLFGDPEVVVAGNDA